MTKFKEIIKDFAKKFIKDFVEASKTEEEIDAMTYLENLYCPNCGEDEELYEFVGTCAGFDEYQCDICNEVFQVPSINK